MIRVLVVDDHELIRDVVSATLRASGHIDVVGACGDGRLAIQEFEALLPDVVLMDLSMPTMGGVDATRELRRIDPEARVVILTSARVSRELDDAFAVGALACVFKDDDPADLISAVLSAAGTAVFDSSTLTPRSPFPTVVPAPRGRWRSNLRQPHE